MKKLMLLMSFFVCASVCQAQSLEERVKVLEDKVARLERLLAATQTDSTVSTVFTQNLSTSEALALTAQEDRKCQAITQSGTRCSRYAQQNGKFCTQHAKMANGSASSQTSTTQRTSTTSKPRSTASSGRCQARTKKGTQCSRQAQPGRKYCWQH